MKKKKFLIIGSSGNLGRNISHELTKYKNVIVYGISKNRNPKIKKLKNYKFDYKKDQLLSSFLKKKNFDIVINLIVFNKKEALREYKIYKNKIKKYIFISSVSVYNESKKLLTEESRAKDIRWPVAKNKFFCEKAFLKLFKEKKFPVIIIRSGHIYNYFTVPSNIIGLGGNLIKLLKSNKPAIIFKKNIKRSILHSKDFAKILIKLLNSSKDIKGKIFNISSSKVITWEKIYRLYFKLLKIKPKFKYVDTQKVYNINKNIYYALVGDRNKSTIFNNSNLKKYIKNYKEETIFENGIKQIIKYQKKFKNLGIDKKIEKIYDSLINQ